MISDSHSTVGLATAALLAVAPAAAQEVGLEEVVVKARPLGRSILDIAQPASVLAGDDLRRRIAPSIGETLSHELGVTATYFGPNASRPVIRGLSGERVLMLENGMSALDVSSLSPDHAVGVDSILAEQVEILKGPATLLYGSGSVGGVVNVRNGRIPETPAGDPVGGAIELRGDTALEERSVAARLDGGFGAVAWHLDYADRSTADVDVPGSSLSDTARADAEAAGEDVDEFEGKVPNSDSDSESSAAGLSWVGERGFIGLAVSRYDTNYGVPGPGEEHEDAAEGLEQGSGEGHSHAGIRIALEQERIDLRSQLRDVIGAGSALRAALSMNEYVHRELEGAETGTLFEQDASEVRIELDHAPVGAWRGTVGVQYVDVDFSASGAEAYVPPSTTESLGFFLFEELALDPATLEFGMRFEQQQIDVDAAAGLPDYDDEAYTLSFGAVVPLGSDWKAAAHVTRSERHPQASELYAFGPHLAVQRFEIGDPDLDTEVGTTFDLSLRRGGHDFEIVTTAFYNRFDDYIYAAPTNQFEDGLPVVRFTQADAEFYGLEAEATLHLLERSDDHLELRLAADYVRGKLRDGGNLPQIPPMRYGAQLHYHVGPWHLGSAIYRYQRQDDLADDESSTRGYTMLDLDVSYRPDWLGEWLLFLRGTNLLDEEARRHSSPLKEYVPLPGRSLTAGLRATF